LHEDNNILSERKKLILKAIIDAHIENGEPVGSKFLMQTKQIAYSSATIRNEMAELEDMGYLEQPHTSAGRIPSEMGYRFYVNSLVDRYNLTQNEITELKQMLKVKQGEVDTILQSAMQLASRLTNYTAMVLKPRQMRILVDRYELMRLDDYTLVLIMVIGQTIKTKHIRSQVPVSQDVGIRLAVVLNEKATGRTAEEFTMPLLMEMEAMMGEYEFLVAPVMKGICETITAFDGGEIRFDGINRLLSYPEYYDMERLKELLALFEKKDDLLRILSEETDVNVSSDERVKIYIGRENLVKIMDNSTLIFKTIRHQGVPVGAIGIIGPTRMDYKRVIAMVDSLTNGVSNILAEGDITPGLPDGNK